MTTTDATGAFNTEDLTRPEVNADPFGYYGRLRESDPVHWNPLFRTWLVTRHDDVQWVTRHHELFSSRIDIPYQDPSEEFPPIDEADWPLAQLQRPYRPFIMHDRPQHQAMRATIHSWFTRQAVERWRGQLAARAAELVDERLEAGTMEVKHDLATPLPLLTICWMLGVPAEDAERLYQLAANAWGGTENTGFGPARLRVGYEAATALREYFTPLIERRGREPREDLLSMMAVAERQGVFTREECLASTMILLDAGHSTTLGLISKGTLAFARHPAAWDRLRADPEALAPSATEECLRYDPPLKMVMLRLATRDVELRGRTIRAGDSVSYVIASANRDPRAFADPETFDITRAPNPHLAFGGGIHHCIGAALARIEGQEALKALARRLRRVRVAHEVQWLPNPVQHMLTELRITWDPGDIARTAR